MIREDVIMAAVNVGFAAALLLQVLRAARERRAGICAATSGLTAGGLLVMVGCGVSLRLWASAATWAVTGSLWTALFYQRLRYGR